MIFDEEAKELLRQADNLLHELDNEIDDPKIGIAHDALHKLASLLADNEDSARRSPRFSGGRFER